MMTNGINCTLRQQGRHAERHVRRVHHFLYGDTDNKRKPSATKTSIKRNGAPTGFDIRVIRLNEALWC